MAIACLITVLPLDIESGARVPVRVCSAQHRSITGLNGVVWEPAVTLPPSLTINLWNGDFKTAVDPGSATFSIDMETIKQSVPMADRYYWQGAPVEIRAEQIGQAWPWAIRFRGIVGSATRKKQILAITANVDNSIFAQKVLTATFSGTGGIEGGSDIKNRLKPLILGYARNVEPILINADYSIYQFSSYGPIEAVTSLFERGSSFGPASGDYPDYASLEAANLAAGTWATCLARGLVRLGAPAYGVITGDVKGHAISGSTPRLTGAIIKAFATLAGIASENLIESSLDALDAAVPYPVNIVQTEQTTFIEIANQMALACNAQTGISLTGSYFVTPVSLDAPATLTLDARGRALPQVASSEELEVSPPYWKTIMGANRSWRVQTADEIAFSAALIDKGIYNVNTTYREGNIVTREDGSQWVYRNITASAGNPPPLWPEESNEWWENSIPPLSAANITYADGRTLQELQPSEPGATVGAPTGTPVGGIDAGDVADVIANQIPTMAADVDFNANTLLAYQYNTQILREYVDAKLFVEGVPVNTVIVQEQSERIEGDAALAQTIALIGAKNGDSSAFILNFNTVKASTTGETLATVISTMNAETAEASASITDLRSIVLNPGGGATAKAVLQLNSNGHVAGLQATNDGTISQVIFSFDSFVLLNPITATPLFVAEGGKVKMTAVEVDTLKVNTAMVPKIVKSTTTYTGGSTTDTTPILNTSLVLPVSGYVSVSGMIIQGFSAGPAPWNYALKINGSKVTEVSATYPGDGVPVFGALWCEAGTITIELFWTAAPSVNTPSRNFLIQAFPNTQ